MSLRVLFFTAEIAIALLASLAAFPKQASAAPPPQTFRFHLLAEPHGLDPQATSANSGNYLFANIYRGLYRYHSQRGLILEGAQACVRSKLTLTCTLNPNHRWSSGEKIVAADYVRSFRRLSDPERRSPQSEIILKIKNGKEILAGQKPVTELGVVEVNANTLRFDLSESDPEFEYRLVNVATAPWPEAGLVDRKEASKLITSGPYMIREWKMGHWITMTKNPSYGLPSAADRPDLEAYFIDSDATAMRLYESGRLNFLRRVPFGELPRYQNNPEFHQFQVARFDYIGFGPALAHDRNLREALATSIDFKTYKALIDSKGMPGCAGIPSRLLDRQPCLKFDPAQAKLKLSKVAKPVRLTLGFSRMGGDDIAQAVEWLQGQWKKNLNLSVELNGEEQGVYLGHLRTDPPALFRKGLGLERPTCLAALEIFTHGNSENYLRLEDRKFDSLVRRLAEAKTDGERRVSCRQAVEYLFKDYRLIPLGEMYFNILAKPEFQGWDLSELNQLDLTDLHFVH